MPIEEELGTKSSHSRAKGGRRANTATSGKLGEAFGRGAAGAERAWDECDPRFLAWVVVSIGALGGACTFGRSRDRSALSLTLLLDSERETIWIAPSDDIEEKLTEIAERLTAML